PERETSLDDVLTPLELPTRRFQAELGTGRAAKVIDLSVNGVRVTLMPHDLGELSGSAVDAARRAGYSTPHPAAGSTCYERRKCVASTFFRSGSSLIAPRSRPGSPGGARPDARRLPATGLGR